MTRLNRGLVAPAVLGLVASSLLAGAEPLQVQAVDKAVDLHDNRLSVRLLNRHDKTVTAWRVSLVRVDETGRGTGTSIYGQDAFRELHRPDPRDIPGGGPIPPGDSVLLEWPLGGDYAQVSVKVIAVLFEDGSSAGDAQHAQEMVSTRRAEVEEIGDLLQRLADIEPGPDALPALRREINRLRQGEAVDTGPESLAPAAVREVVSSTRTLLASTLEETVLTLETNPTSPNDTQITAFLKLLEEDYASGLSQLPHHNSGG